MTTSHQLLCKSLLSSTMAMVLLFSSTLKAQEETTLPDGSYFGQTPPGPIAVPFAPGIISKEGWDGEAVYSPDMTEFYYTTSGGISDRRTLYGYRLENNKWKKFIETPRNIGEVTFSPDGKRMHMAKKYKERIGNSWSEIKSIGPEIDRKDFGIMRLSSSITETYVFDNYLSDAIWIARLENGQRQAPTKLDKNINTGKWTAHPYITADESYLIWDSERDGGYGKSDIYISFKQEDGSWGPAINMGDRVNTNKSEFYASVTPDGKYILFNRKIDDDNTDIYWVDAQIIQDLQMKNK